MSSGVVRSIVVCGLLLVLSSVARAADGTTTAAVCGTSLTNNLYRLCFDGKTWKVDEPSNSRFTNRDRVEVELQHFNFIRYTLAFDVKEEKSESYQYLTKLWGSILSPDILGLVGLGIDADRDPANALVTAMRDLNRRTIALDQRVSTLVSTYTKTGLTGPQALALEAAVGTDAACDPGDADAQLGKPNWPAGEADSLLKHPVRRLLCGVKISLARLQREILTSDASFTAVNGKQSKLYAMVTEAVSTAMTRTDTFIARADKTTGVENRKLGKHEAGTRVTLNVAAVGDGGERTAIADVNYLVETTMPLVAHVGVTMTGLNDVSFKKVKKATSLGEDELFQKTSDGDDSTGFSLFLSWKVGTIDHKSTPNKSIASLLVSLGTDTVKPGRRIFAGPSLMLVNRVVVTGGLAFGKESEGEQQTLAPDIFQIVKERPNHSYFFALSMKVH
jgi:hypothetical protein